MFNKKNEDQANIDQPKGRVSKFGIKGLSFFVIFFGVLAIFSLSIISGLLIVIAGLILMPSIKNYISSMPLHPIIKKSYVLNSFALALFFFGMLYGSSVVENKSKKDWDLNKVSIIQKINENIQQNNLSAANSLITKYLNVGKNDPDFKNLREKLEGVEKLAENQKKSEVASTGSGELSGGEDPDLVGKCLGYVAKEIQTKGAQSVDSRHMSYLNARPRYVQAIQALMQTHPACFAPGAMIGECLRGNGVNSYQIDFVNGYNTGIVMYQDPTNRAIMSAACMK
jgi:hypothetical protein